MFLLLCFFFCRRPVPLLAAGHALHPAGFAQEGASPQRFCRVFFGFFFLRLVALFCFSLGGWVSPCRVFPSPRLVGVSSLWVGGFPLPCFPCVFPAVSWVGGGAFSFCFFLPACCLLHLASPTVIPRSKNMGVIIRQRGYGFL